VTERILGIDPGLRVTGYGVIEFAAGKTHVVEAGVVSPRASSPLEARLRELHAGIERVVASTHPDVIVIEELYTTYRNPMTAIMMGHARGVLCLAGAQAGIPVATLAHSRVKRALVGSGAGRKEQVNRMVAQLLGFSKPLEPDDVSDALALALAYCNVREHDRRLPERLRHVL
jgi:crossover junction endodeoxyribonuclease RuvC